MNWSQSYAFDDLPRTIVITCTVLFVASDLGISPHKLVLAKGHSCSNRIGNSRGIQTALFLKVIGVESLRFQTGKKAVIVTWEWLMISRENLMGVEAPAWLSGRSFSQNSEKPSKIGITNSNDHCKMAFARTTNNEQHLDELPIEKLR
jgi:hypothetical protein